MMITSEQPDVYSNLAAVRERNASRLLSQKRQDDRSGIACRRMEVEEQPEEAETRRRSRCINLRSNARGEEGKHAGRGLKRDGRGRIIRYGRRPMAECSLVTMP